MMRAKSIYLFSLSTAVAGIVLYLLHYSYGFNFADEGYYWYGAQRTLKGEIPGIDFLSYEPGRYYWAALIFNLLGNDSNAAARISSILLGALGFGFTTMQCLPSQEGRCRPRRILVAIFLPCILAVWSIGYYRIIDVVLPGVIFSSCYILYSRRSPRSAFISGFALGLALFCGRNHALYGFLSLLITYLHLHLQQGDWRVTLKLLLRTLAGWATGASPFLLLVLSNPTYPGNIISQWLDVFRVGRTNLPLPLPWPWIDIDFKANVSAIEGRLLIGMIFLALVAAAVVGNSLLLYLSLKRKSPSAYMAAGCATTLGYLHYALSRADALHIGTCFVPLLLGLAGWAAQRGKNSFYLMIGLLLLTTIRVGLREQSAYHCIRGTMPCAEIRTGVNQTVIAGREVSERFKRIQSRINGKQFLALPAYPALYAYNHQRSPTWDIYAAWPHTEHKQLEEIKRIRDSDPEVVLISDNDFGESTRFSKMNPLVMRYILETYAEAGHIEDGMILYTKRVP